MIKYLKKYKISDKVIKLITEAMKNWKLELTVGVKILAEGKIWRGISPGKSFFAITICNSNDATQSHNAEMHWGYKFTKLPEKINHLIYTDDIKLFEINEK